MRSLMNLASSAGMLFGEHKLIHVVFTKASIYDKKAVSVMSFEYRISSFEECHPSPIYSFVPLLVLELV